MTDHSEHGYALPRGITRAFWSVVIVAFIITGFLAIEVRSAHDLGAKDRRLIAENALLIRKVAADHATIRQIEITQDDSCENFLVMRKAINDFHGTIRKVLKSGIATDLKRAASIGNPTLAATDRASARTLQKILDETHTVSARCSQVFRPAVPRKKPPRPKPAAQ